MKTFKLPLLLIFSGLLVSLNDLAQDAITWSRQRNGAKVADTVALEDYYLPLNNIVYIEAVLECY